MILKNILEQVEYLTVDEIKEQTIDRTEFLCDDDFLQFLKSARRTLSRLNLIPLSNLTLKESKKAYALNHMLTILENHLVFERSSELQESYVAFLGGDTDVRKI